jgi:hypothetical protein
MAVYGGVAAVVFSFVVLSVFWHSSRFDPSDGRELPAWLSAILESPAVRMAVRVVGLVAALILVATTWLGPNDVSRNPAPTWFYVWFWVGILPVSLLLGPAVRALNPLRTIVTAIGRGRAPREMPAAWGYWPAVASLLSFLWLELVYDNPSGPRVVGGYLLTYALVHLMGGLRYGADWFSRADGFEVYSTVVGSLSPLGRRSDARWVLRNPLSGLSALPTAPGLVAVVCVLLGSTAFDGLSRTSVWKDWTQNIARAPYLIYGTLGLAAAICLVFGVYAAALALTKPYAPGANSLPEAFVHSLVPIACGYTVAHYFSFAVFQGQEGFLLASDPLGRGWNLLGTAGQPIDYTVISTQTIAVVQVAAIVLGHVLGVIAAHDRSMAVFPKRTRKVGQLPLLFAMVGFTMSGIALIVGT